MPMGGPIIEARAPIEQLLLRTIASIQPADAELYALLLQMTQGKLPILREELAIHLALGATPKSPRGPRASAPSSANRRISTKRIKK